MSKLWMKLGTCRYIVVSGVALGLASLSPAARAAAGPAEVRNLIAVLQRSDASLHDKARACQQLGEFGTKEAVPALAALLSDEVLSAYARSGLEGIPDPSAAAALRSALTSLKGNRLIGVVNSLGVIRDVMAVGALSKLAGDPGSGVVKEALLALGRISNGESIRIVQRALSAGPEVSRPDAAAACLIAAGFQLASGNAQTAVALYDAVRTANVPLPYRLGATRGAILARKPNGIDLLVGLLKSDDREIRNVALLTVREIPSDKLAEALNAELESAKPELQAQLIEVMADCHNPRSIQAVRAKAASESPLIRQAAFRTLGKIGDRSDAGVLLKALGDARSPAEISAASASLARIEGAEVDAMILRTLAATADARLRVTLIDLLDARSPASATSELLKQAADPDPKVSLAAYRAMRSLVGLNEVPALIALTKTCTDGALRAAAETALYYACTRTTDTEQAGEMVLAELKRTTQDLDKSSWIKTLASMGYNKALPAIAPSLRDPNSWLVTVTIDNLKKWPSPAPIDDLLGLAETSSNTSVRARALTGAVQLATAAGNGRQAPDAAVVAWFQRAGKAVRSAEEKRVVVSGLGRWTHVESIRLLLPYLDDADLRTEAAFAILSAAGPVAEGPDYAILKPVLERISGMGSPLLADRVSTLERTIAATESAMKGQKGKL
jgi:HEAT repeat protein